MVVSQAFMQAVQGSDDGGFNVRTLLLFIGGAVLLAFFSSLGLIARMRDHRSEERKRTDRSASGQVEGETSDSGGPAQSDPNR